MSTREIGIEDGRAKLGDLVIDAQRGTSTHITRHGKPAATLVGPISDELLGQVDAYASEHGLSPAAAIGVLLGEALTAARPYTVTIRDIQTGVREVSSRHSSLGAAVEALRREQEYDCENNGLPSWQPRVEHDGRPVDVETAEEQR